MSVTPDPVGGFVNTHASFCHWPQSFGYSVLGSASSPKRTGSALCTARYVFLNGRSGQQLSLRSHVVEVMLSRPPIVGLVPPGRAPVAAALIYHRANGSVYHPKVDSSAAGAALALVVAAAAAFCYFYSFCGFVCCCSCCLPACCRSSFCGGSSATSCCGSS